MFARIIRERDFEREGKDAARFQRVEESVDMTGCRGVEGVVALGGGGVVALGGEGEGGDAAASNTPCDVDGVGAEGEAEHALGLHAREQRLLRKAVPTLAEWRRHWRCPEDYLDADR